MSGKMKYRTNRATDDRISVIGLGTSMIGWKDIKTGAETLSFALENGINYFDLAGNYRRGFDIFGEVIGSGPWREKVRYQGHFGAVYDTGVYGKSIRLDDVKRSVDDQLKRLKTDYIDYGFIHCLDRISEWEQYQKNGVLDFLMDCQNEGIVDYIGASSHTPEVINEILDLGIVDMLMFSTNPAYDYEHGEYSFGSVSERAKLYRRCEAEDIGISVMKPFGGGQLLDGRRSVFGQALTPVQCIQYALDKPGVLTVLPGAASKEEVQSLLAWLDASDEEKDYSLISSITPEEAMGKCVYCNHCAPCPAGINIGLVNKYYDLAQMGDEMAADHYRRLDKHASDCIGCGHCDDSCPFHVRQSERMEEIKAFFGE